MTAAGAQRTWLVLGDKLGDNAQVEIIAERLGWPFERKILRFKPAFVQGKPPFRPSLDHVDLDQSSALSAPWPDLIITIGRRPGSVAMWIRDQSGGRTKLVLIGRPRRMLDQFDLIVAPPQFRLPIHEKVLPLTLPLMRPNEAAIASAADRWRPAFADLPRPLTAILVGGQTKPYRFDGEVAKDLLAKAQRASNNQGTLFFTTSRRTPDSVVQGLKAALPDQARLYEWRAGADDNPYLGLLALADRFVVTGDSISMMVEVARLAKPLAIFPLPVQSGPLATLQGLRRQVRGKLSDRGTGAVAAGFGPGRRDLGAVHSTLVAQGLASWLGDRFPEGGQRPVDDLGAVTARIAAMMASARPC